MACLPHQAILMAEHDHRTHNALVKGEGWGLHVHGICRTYKTTIAPKRGAHCIFGLPIPHPLFKSGGERSMISYTKPIDLLH